MVDKEEVNARRDSLAQEIRETLLVRGFFAPKRIVAPDSDLIGAVGMALDEQKARIEQLETEIATIQARLL
jgi:hypothetical protein